MLSNEDKIRIQKALSDNMESQDNILDEIMKVDMLINDKVNMTPSEQIWGYTLSELEERKNKYKDLLYDLQTEYKKLKSFIN